MKLPIYLKFGLFTFGLVIFLFSPVLLRAENGDLVTKAYNLRMEGNLDSAKTILENTLKIDSTNALAWFELYRTFEHLRNGDPRTITNTSDSKNCLQKAHENDLDNAYYLYLQANLEVLDYYIKLMTQEDKDGLPDLLLSAENLYVKAADKNPLYLPGLLTLVEFFALMPPDMGGDPVKAEKYILRLEKADSFLGTKARSMKLPDGENEIEYWKGVLEKRHTDANVIELLGRAYLIHNGNAAEAKKYFDQAIDLDPTKKNLYLVLGRFHMMEARQNFEKKDSILLLMDQRFSDYLDMVPDASNVMKAWTLSKIAQGKMFAGKQEEGKKFMEKAKALDPYFPIAFAAPKEEVPPEKAHTKVVQEYFLRPY